MEGTPPPGKKGVEMNNGRAAVLQEVWELEDETRSTLDTTLDIMRDSMRGVMSYLTVEKQKANYLM